MKNLKNKTALITGASAGFGKEIALEFARAGANVIITGRTLSKLEELANTISKLGVNATAAALDLRQSGSITKLVEQHSELDILVNNAGLGYLDPIKDISLDKVREMYETNVFALLEGCQAAVNSFTKQDKEGWIVNISSVAALRGATGAYGSTKHAVNSITESFRVALQKTPIRMVNIMPGAFATSFVRNMDPAIVKQFMSASGEDIDFEQGEQIPADILEKAQKAMQKQLGDPNYVAKAVIYAVSQPSFVNVQDIVIRPQIDFGG